MADVDENQEFESGDSGASTTFPQQASAVRKNGHIIIKGRPCKVVEMSTSKTGKHGHAKVRNKRGCRTRLIVELAACG